MSPITLLTYDPAAGMAYLYFAAPGTLAWTGIEGVRTNSAVRVQELDACRAFDARIDHAADGTALGAEFEATSPAQALSRAAAVMGNC